MTKDTIKEGIIERLKEVFDPEIPINVYDLGLIYEITVKDEGFVHILMSLTSPTCPTADYIKALIKDAALDTPHVSDVEVELTFEPRWTPDRVSQEAKEELGLVDQPQEDLSVQQTFVKDEGPKEKICFNCGATQSVKPIFSCFFKDESTFICSSCISKF